MGKTGPYTLGKIWLAFLRGDRKLKATENMTIKGANLSEEQNRHYSSSELYTVLYCITSASDSCFLLSFHSLDCKVSMHCVPKCSAMQRVSKLTMLMWTLVFLNSVILHQTVIQCKHKKIVLKKKWTRQWIIPYNPYIDQWAVLTNISLGSSGGNLLSSVFCLVGPTTPPGG